jgi:hypothetical protein
MNNFGTSKILKVILMLAVIFLITITGCIQSNHKNYYFNDTYNHMENDMICYNFCKQNQCYDYHIPIECDNGICVCRIY